MQNHQNVGYGYGIGFCLFLNKAVGNPQFQTKPKVPTRKCVNRSQYNG